MAHLEMDLTSNEDCPGGVAAQFLTSYFVDGALLRSAQEPVVTTYRPSAERLLFRAQGIADRQRYAAPRTPEVIGASLIQICVRHKLPRLELVMNALVVADMVPDDRVSSVEIGRAIRKPWTEIEAHVIPSADRATKRTIHYLPTAHPEVMQMGHDVYAVPTYEDGPILEFGILGTEELVVPDQNGNVIPLRPAVDQ